MSSQQESSSGVDSDDSESRALTSADVAKLIGVRVRITSKGSGIRYTGTVFSININERSILLTDVKVISVLTKNICSLCLQ